MKILKEILKKIRNLFRHLIYGNLMYEHQEILKEIDSLKIIIGNKNTMDMDISKIKNIQDAEFKIYSQFGEDGIIQFLIKKYKVENKKFIEFGVGNYSESNTRFLLVNNNWEGLIINDDNSHIEFLNSEIGKIILYKHRIKIINKKLTLENVNKTFKEEGFSGEIGILSIDVDGIDYWFLKEIDSVSPKILIVEYNSTFGKKFEVTVPYKKEFDRTKEHFSNLYFGASLKAIVNLAKSKGYIFVGSNSAGNNAFFIRQDKKRNNDEISVENGYVESRYRESMDKNRNLTLIDDHHDRLNLIRNLKLYDINSKKKRTIKEIYKL